MDRIIKELKEALAGNHGGALIQFNTEETKKLLTILENQEALEIAASNASWAESNALDARRNSGYEQGEG